MKMETLLLTALCIAAAPAAVQAEMICTKMTQNVSSYIKLSNDLKEVRGFAVSRKYPEYIWTVSENGSNKTLSAVDRNGTIFRSFYLYDSDDSKWEDIALAPCEKGSDKTCIYIADVGNSDIIRNNKKIIMIPEPDLSRDGNNAIGSVKLKKVWQVRFPTADGNVDAAAVMVNPISAQIYLFSRSYDGLPQTMYHLNRDDADHEGKLLPIANCAFQPADADTPKSRLAVLSADFAPSGDRFVLRTLDAVYEYDLTASEDMAEVCAAPVKRVAAQKYTFNEKDDKNTIREYSYYDDGEAVAYDSDGKSILLSIDAADISAKKSVDLAFAAYTCIDNPKWTSNPKWSMSEAFSDYSSATDYNPIVPIPRAKWECESYKLVLDSEQNSSISLPASELMEISGLAASRNNPGLLWAHVDSDGLPDLYLLNERGQILHTYRINNEKNIDWEDIAVGPCTPYASDNCIYIADMGDNLFIRNNKKIFSLREPSLNPMPAEDISSIDVLQTWNVQYPDSSKEPKFANPDSESLMVHPETAELYIVSKQSNGGAQTLYRIPRSGMEARKILEPLADYTFTSFFGSLKVLFNAATAADFAPDGSKFLVRTYAAVYEYDLVKYTDIAESFKNPRTLFDTSELQGESAAYADDGGIYTAAEGYPVNVGRPTMHRYACVRDVNWGELNNLDDDESEHDKTPQSKISPCLNYTPVKSDDESFDFSISKIPFQNIRSMASSRKNPEYIWAAADDGTSNIYLLDAEQKIYKTLTINQNTVPHFSALAVGPCNADLKSECIYAVDMGEPDSSGDETIVIINEPDLSVFSTNDVWTVNNIQKYYLRFPTADGLDKTPQAQDVRAMFVNPMSSQIYIIASPMNSSEHTLYHAARDCRAKNDDNTERLCPEFEGTLLPVAHFDFAGDSGYANAQRDTVTDADFSSDGTRILIRTYDSIYEADAAAYGNPADAFASARRLFASSEVQGQAVCYAADGKSIMTADAVSNPMLHKYACSPNENWSPNQGTQNEYFNDCANPYIYPPLPGDSDKTDPDKTDNPGTSCDDPSSTACGSDTHNPDSDSHPDCINNPNLPECGEMDFNEDTDKASSGCSALPLFSSSGNIPTALLIAAVICGLAAMRKRKV